ncbi:MAG: carboxyl transferase domain-containing protein [Oscillospiraceae bacterium]|nr:carboxyl transferase domain-containing protein [Oscillospiraceae bacterium]
MSEKSKKMSAKARLETLFDDGVYFELEGSAQPGAAVAAYGSVGGATVFALCQDSAVDAGAVDAAHARKWNKVYELAAKTGAPVVTLYDSVGVRVNEGFSSLEASSKILRSCSALSGVVPQIAVVLGTCAGFASMAAAMADVCVMAKDAQLFLTSAFADKAAGGATKEVGSAAFAERAGGASVVCDDEKAAIEKAAQLLRLLPLNNLDALPRFDAEAPAFSREGSPIETTADADSVLELSANTGKHARTALVTLGGTPCGMLEANGRLCRKDTAKCAKLVELCDAFNLPVVCFVNSDGFTVSAENDELGGIKAAAGLAHVLGEATTAKLSVVTGSAIGAAFTTFCSKNCGADMTYALDGAVISALPCEAAAALRHEKDIKADGDIAALGAAYAADEASAAAALKAGVIDAVIAPEATRDTLIAAVDMLSTKRVSRLPKKHGNLPL